MRSTKSGAVSPAQGVSSTSMRPGTAAQRQHIESDADLLQQLAPARRLRSQIDSFINQHGQQFIYPSIPMIGVPLDHATRHDTTVPPAAPAPAHAAGSGGTSPSSLPAAPSRCRSQAIRAADDESRRSHPPPSSLATIGQFPRAHFRAALIQHHWHATGRQCGQDALGFQLPGPRTVFPGHAFPWFDLSQQQRQLAAACACA